MREQLWEKIQHKIQISESPTLISSEGKRMKTWSDIVRTLNGRQDSGNKILIRAWNFRKRFSFLIHEDDHSQGRTDCPSVLSNFSKLSKNRCRPGLWDGWVDHWRLLPCTSNLLYFEMLLKKNTTIKAHYYSKKMSAQFRNFCPYEHWWQDGWTDGQYVWK